jgi:hypothetical protein
MRFDGWKLGYIEVWWLGVFIAPTTKMVVGEGLCRMAHRIVRCATGHCLVCQPRHQAVGFRPLELLTCGPSDSPVVHRTVTVHYLVRLLMTALTSARAGAHCSISLFLCRRSLALFSRYSAGTPDSPVLHRTVRWIIAEWLPKFPKVASLEWISLVHRTLSGGTPDSPVRQTRAAFGCFAPLFLNPFFELCIDLLWTFDTCRTYDLKKTS